jgi:8-oxo-dGTP diphosphatase
MSSVGKYPNTYYRVSVKALIENDEGKVLFCKENSPNWNLPGGGVDHGEEPLAALKRELHEELGTREFTSAELSSVATFCVEEMQVWMLWVVYEVTLPDFNFVPGELVNDVAFLDMAAFKHSTKRAEKLAYQAYLNKNKTL